MESVSGEPSLTQVPFSKIEKMNSLWTGGDNSGIITVKNTYLALLSTQGLKKVLGWRQALWKWDLQLKIKCFIWLAVENKILTWENLKLEDGKDRLGVTSVFKRLKALIISLFTVPLLFQFGKDWLRF
jgi:hypothetical protein